MSFEIFFPVPPSSQNLMAMEIIDAESGVESAWDQNYQTPHRGIAFAKVRGVVQSYCVYTLDRRRVSIERIVTTPMYRRQGLASQLVNEIAERFAPCIMQITIDANNIEANDWARKLAFAATKFIRGCSSKSDRIQLEFMEIDEVI